MYYHTYLYVIALLVVFSSCVTNKKYLYLQGGDVNAKGLPLDSVVRTYESIDFNYHIQPQDIISVRFESLTPKEYDFLNVSGQQGAGMNMVQGNPLLIGDLVDANGEIPFPFLGKVKVAGLTVFEIQNKLQEIASQYLSSPVVKVRLLNFRFTLLGEVNSEGTVTVQNNRVSIVEAIGLAGGLSELADKNQIKLIRSVDGVSTVAYINLLDENFIASPYYYLHQNDVIVVPPLRQRPFRRYFSQNLSLFLSVTSIVLLTINLLN